MGRWFGSRRCCIPTILSRWGRACCGFGNEGRDSGGLTITRDEGVRPSGKPNGFCLKKNGSGETLPWIFKVEFDPTRPNAAILRVTLEQREGLEFYYAAGSAPYANLVDENDMAAPGFGPVDVK